ncbi:MAG: transposase [Candidatus Hydrogenedentota bacterium]
MRNQKTSDEKLSIVLEGLREKKPVIEICRRHGITQSQYYKMRDKFLEGGMAALSGKKFSSREAELMSKITKLKRIVGRVTIGNEILKKTEELMGRR